MPDASEPDIIEETSPKPTPKPAPTTSAAEKIPEGKDRARLLAMGQSVKEGV